MIPLYLSHLSHLSSKTLRTKEALLKHLEDFGDIYTEKDLSEFIAFLRKKNLSDSTIRKVLSEVQSYLRWKGIHLDIKPYLRAIHSHHRANPFSEEEIKILFQALRQHHPIYYIFSLVLLHSGIRVSEALSLQAQDFEIRVFRKETEDYSGYEEKEVFFVSVRSGKFKKPYRAGMPLLTEEEKTILKKFLSQRQNRPLWSYILKYPKSQKEIVLTLHSVHKFYQRLSEELGFEVYPHRFRYTYATRLLARGFSTALVQSWLGHKSPNTTLMAYARAQEEVELGRVL